MIATIETKALIESLKVALKATATGRSKASKPILGCVVIDASRGDSRLLACDLEFGVEVRLIGCQVDAPGRVAVDAAELKKCLPKPTESAEVTLIADESGLTLITEVGEYGLDLEGPTAHPSHDWDREHRPGSPLAFAHSGDLARSLLGCYDHTDPDSTRYALAGIAIESDRPVPTGHVEPDRLDEPTGTLALVATDGRRLMVERCEAAFGTNLAARYWREAALDSWNHGGPNGSALVLPAGQCKRVADVIKAGSKGLLTADVTAICRVSDSTSAIRCGSVTFRLRHLDGRFPNWRAVLPCSFESTWKVRVDALAATVDRAARLASRENRSVDLAVADAKLLLEVGRVSRRNAFAYRGEVPVDGALPGESPGVSLDVTYLQDGLKAFEKAGIAEAHCRYIDPKSPFRLDTYRGETPGPSYILMPLNRDR